MLTDIENTFSLKQETIAEIDTLIPKYPTKRSCVLPLLHRIQAENGFISRPAMEWVAEKLELTPINVWEVVSFYPGLREKPTGKRLVRICRTLPCALKGAYGVCDTFKKEFSTDLDEISPDGNVTIEFSECLADCGKGPVLMIDDELYEDVSQAQAKELCDAIKAGGELPTGRTYQVEVEPKKA